jgi:hypothetical protein
LSLSALQAVSKFIQVLQGIPAAVIIPDHIGLRRPTGTADLPMIAVSIANARESPVGIGQHVALTRIGAEEWATTSGSRCTGELQAELWAANATAATAISTMTSAVLGRLNEQAAALRIAGFVDLSLKSLGPAQPATVGPHGAFMMPLVFETTYEDLATPPPGGEGIIRTVHVGLTGELEESMEIK